MNVLEYSMPRMNYGYPQPRPSNPTRNGGIFTSGETRDTKTSCSKEIMYLHLRVSDRLDGWKFELGKSFYLQPSIYLSFCQISRPDLETLIRLFQTQNISTSCSRDEIIIPQAETLSVQNPDLILFFRCTQFTSAWWHLRGRGQRFTTCVISEYDRDSMSTFTQPENAFNYSARISSWNCIDLLCWNYTGLGQFWATPL